MRGVWLTRLRAKLLRPLAWVYVLNALGFVAYTLPRTLQEHSLSARARALKTDVDRERGNTTRLQQRAAVIRENVRDTDGFYKRVLQDQNELVKVFAQLDKAAPSAGARSYRPEEVKGAAVSRFVVTMPVSGSYPQLLGFLRAIERLPYFVTIDRLSLREREPNADLDVELSVYFRGLPLEKRG